MYKILIVVLFLLVGLTAASAQNRHQREAPVLVEVSNQALVQSVFPEATEVKKVDAYWFKIVNKKGKTLGFAMTSSDYCKDVKGYNNTTPVMIITDLKYTIKKVSLLSNYETQSYVKRLETAGFFDNWVGSTIQTAKNAQIDGFTGATYTANAVTKNITFLLENGGKKLPKR